MSTRAAAARDHAAPSRAPRPRTRPTEVRSRPRHRRRFRFRLRLGLLTIPLVAVLFAGVVFINSKELALVKRQGQVVRQTAAVQDQLARLNARQDKIDVTVRARAERMGMVSPSSDALQYVKARPTTTP